MTKENEMKLETPVLAGVRCRIMSKEAEEVLLEVCNLLHMLAKRSQPRHVQEDLNDIEVFAKGLAGRIRKNK